MKTHNIYMENQIELQILSACKHPNSKRDFTRQEINYIRHNPDFRNHLLIWFNKHDSD